MDISAEFNARYHDLVVAAVNIQHIDKLLDEYQTRWDNEDKFDLSSIGMMSMMDPAAWKRDPANESAELDACLSQIADQVTNLVLTDWVKHYTSEQVAAVIDALRSLDPNGGVVIGGQIIPYHKVDAILH